MDTEWKNANHWGMNMAMSLLQIDEQSKSVIYDPQYNYQYNKYVDELKP